MQRLVILFLAVTASIVRAQTVTTPAQQFGHPIGADYVLPNYTQLSAYWRKLDGESDRLTVVSIGKTSEGRDQLMAIVTSPENHAQLARLKQIGRRLALADGIAGDEEARALAAEGKAIVWIDGGLHASEVLGAQQLMETVYQLVSRSDPETMRILNDVIVLAVHANPDGHELLADWYMRNPEPARRSTAGAPRLYQKYAGHDNNRDSYMNALAETRNMSRVQYREWFPQIVYNHHQTGPTGAVLFAPPFRDPFNYNFDPLIPAKIDAVGAAMHTRFISENKPGAVTRRATNYSTWWNGGLRTTVYFHNMIGLLTETIGNPTPIDIAFVPRYQLPSTDVFMPIQPQKAWHFRQSVDYSVTANYAVLDYASRHREQLLFDIYRMGRNSIERGSRDHWTTAAWEVEAVREAFAADSAAKPAAFRRLRYDNTQQYFARLRDPAARDARGYILPANQPDFGTATRFVNALMLSGVSVHRARAAFTVGGAAYPAGSYVVKAAQPFRPHVRDMFEPQEHPNDFRYRGGPPIAPYDNAGYTLAFQMGVRFDRVMDDFDGPFDVVRDTAAMPAGRVVVKANAKGYSFAPSSNDAFRALSRLLAAGHVVRRSADGAFVVEKTPGLEAFIARIATQTGVTFSEVERVDSSAAVLVRPRVALWDRYGGSMPSGWMRYIFEQFEVPFEVVYVPDLDAGRLREKYDVIILPSGAIRDPSDDREPERPDTLPLVPAEWRARIGEYTKDKTAPRLREFVEAGGRLIAIGSSWRAAADLELPVENALVTIDSAGKRRRLPREKFYVPGSVLEMKLDTAHPVAAGSSERVNVLFDESPAFRIADSTTVRAIGWYDKHPLRSGWAWGQEQLEGTIAAFDAQLGQGRVYVFGPEITFRAQAHGTFKLLFNAIYP